MPIDATTMTGPDKIIETIATGAIPDPFPLYERLREIDPGLHWSDALGGWVCTRYDHVKQMLGDHHTFSSDYFHETPTGVHDPARAEHRRFIEISSQQFMLSDPPYHTRIRSIFRNTFTRKMIQQWKTITEDVTDNLLRKFRAGEEIDVMSRLAAEVPAVVIGKILGVPAEDTAKFRAWTDSYVDTFNPLVQGDRRNDSISGSLDLFDYLTGLVEQRRTDPQDDLISLISTTEAEDGASLDTNTVVSQLGLILIAGNETTTNLIGNGTTILINNTSAKSKLIEDPSLINRAIEEFLRLDPPLHFLVRKAVEDIDIGGCKIRAGQLCLQLIAAANRDPRNFETPEEFSLDRFSNHHLTFAHGIHFCIGAALARMEGEVVFRKLLEQFPHFTAGKVDAHRRMDTAITRGWRNRPIILLP